MSVAVITATTGSPLLADALASVVAQTYDPSKLQHWVCVDGPEHAARVRELLLDAATKPSACARKLLELPENTGGASGYVCHRIYAAAPWLVNTEYVCFLDEDNAYEKEHVELLVQAVRGKRWAHSLRSVMNQRGDIVDKDQCENLGGIRHSVLGPQDFFVDTNCYFLETALARQLSPCWNVPARPGQGRLEADRAVCQTLVRSKLLPGVSRAFTVRYRVSGRPDSVSASFFHVGNAVTRFDPEKPDVYLFHFTPSATAACLLMTKDEEFKNPLGQWAPTMWQGLWRTYNVLDGFANAAIIPSGAVVVASVWTPAAFPLDLFKRRDVRRILCMVESPNIRHAQQYSRDFLDAHADIVLTYWTDLLHCLGPDRSMWFPMNTHQLDLDDPVHRNLGLRSNSGAGKSVAIVLERRSLHGTYIINGTTLQCLDPLREVYARGLRDLHCYGQGWEGVVCRAQIKSSLGAMADPSTSVDILQRYVFGLIVENCDAHGYVSEKFYDCLMAGAIPLYYGSPCEAHAFPADCWVDLRQFETGEDVQRYLDALSAEEVARKRAAVMQYRERILRSVGVSAFADILDQALRKCS